jgi:hypothetical protein
MEKIFGKIGVKAGLSKKQLVKGLGRLLGGCNCFLEYCGGF